MMETLFVLLLPLLGTAAGAAGVFFWKEGSRRPEGLLDGFAAGVMAAASVWSLLLPALERCGGMGRLAFLPAALGLGLGGVGMLGLGRKLADGVSLTAAAVTIHNFPEGMAVGAAAAGYLAGEVSWAACLALSLGIGIQNLPEGAIVSLPLAQAGMKRLRAFLRGVLSGVIEPVGGILTVCLARLAVPLLPWMLAFSAGAMLWAAAELMNGKTGDGRKVSYLVGFALMMSLDVALG